MTVPQIEAQLENLPGFRLLRNLRHPKEVTSFIGRIESYSQPKRTVKGDMQCHFIVCDPTVSDVENGLLVQFYMPSVEMLPKPYVGCIMVFERFKLMENRGYMQAWSNNQSRWHLYDANGMRELARPGGSARDPLTAETFAFVRSLADWFKVQDGLSPDTILKAPIMTSVSSGTMKRKLAFIKDMEVKNFYDVYAYVVKTFPARENAYELWITDYTENRGLHEYEYGTSAKWPGPYGRRCLCVTLWDQVAQFGRDKLHDDMYVLLRNVHTSYSKSGILEGNIRFDERNPDRQIAILQSNDTALKPMRIRQLHDKKNFEQNRVTLEREKLAASLAAKALEMPEPAKLNENISTSHGNIPITPVGEIIYQSRSGSANAQTQSYSIQADAHKYRTVGRLIDHWPADLRDFSKPFCYTCGKTFYPAKPEVMKSHRHCTLCGSENSRDDPEHYELGFTTLLEGHDGRHLPIIWSGDELETLLDDTELEACNLYDPANKRILSMLQERLFLLWGPLQEAMLPVTGKKRKAKGISEDDLPNLQLCVMAYRISYGFGQAGSDGWRYKGFGTRIDHGSSTSRVKLLCGGA